jgi:hypothetical protein
MKAPAKEGEIAGTKVALGDVTALHEGLPVHAESLTSNGPTSLITRMKTRTARVKLTVYGGHQQRDGGAACIYQKHRKIRREGKGVSVGK